jgi:hypothetical protein
MKKILTLALLVPLLFSCKQDSGKEIKDVAEIVDTDNKEDYYGIWTGVLEPVFEQGADSFYVPEQKITIKINRIVGDVVHGHSIVEGVLRPLKGKMGSRDGNMVFFTLDEPGGKDNDGSYALELVKGGAMQGRHVLYKKQPGTTLIKKLTLAHRQFVYNPNFMLSEDVEYVDWDDHKTEKVSYPAGYEEGDGGDSIAAVENDTLENEEYIEEYYRTASDQIYKINASTTKLEEEGLKNLRKLDLEIIRNTIFARHGYAFKKLSIRSFFEANFWYVPIADNVDKDLTPLEKKNIALLKRLEEYAEDHYDLFGR